MIPSEFSFQQFQLVIRKRLKLKQTQVIYIVVKSNKTYSGGIIYIEIVSVDKLMSYVYEREKDEDGFLYMKYSGQEYAGCN